MKKKIVFSVIVLAFVMILTQGRAFAKDVDKTTFSYYIPDRFVVYSDDRDETSEYCSYGTQIDNNFSIISLYSSKISFSINYTQSDLEERINTKKELYEVLDNRALISISGKMIELNGVKGYRTTEYFKYNDDDTIQSEDVYELYSDNYMYTIDVWCPKKYVDSAEEKKIINSFKIKDTILQSQGIPFIDVASNAWYYNAVKYVYENNIIKGYNDYTFAPIDKVTRGMLVTILYRMEGSPKVTGTPKFSDVKNSSKYYYKAVKWATDKGIVSGYDNGKFGPDDNIQRQQLAVILNKYAKYKGKKVTQINDLKEFSDSNLISKYALTQMKWAVGAGVISGNENRATGKKTLNPKGEANRAEVAAMMQKYCKNIGR